MGAVLQTWCVADTTDTQGYQCGTTLHRYHSESCGAGDTKNIPGFNSTVGYLAVQIPYLSILFISHCGDADTTDTQILIVGVVVVENYTVCTTLSVYTR